MDNIINELYYGRICPVEQMGRLTPKQGRAILKQVQESEEKPEKSLSEQEKATLHSILDDRIMIEPAEKQLPEGEASVSGVPYPLRL